MECGHAPMTNVNKELVIDQATVVWTLDNTICWIALYPVDNTIHFAITYPLDSDLSNYGQLADGPTRRRQLADILNQVETSARWTLVNIINDYNSLRREWDILFTSEADVVIGDVYFTLFALRSL